MKRGNGGLIGKKNTPSFSSASGFFDLNTVFENEKNLTWPYSGPVYSSSSFSYSFSQGNTFSYEASNGGTPAWFIALANGPIWYDDDISAYILPSVYYTLAQINSGTVIDLEFHLWNPIKNALNQSSLGITGNVSNNTIICRRLDVGKLGFTPTHLIYGNVEWSSSMYSSYYKTSVSADVIDGSSISMTLGSYEDSRKAYVSNGGGSGQLNNPDAPYSSMSDAITALLNEYPSGRFTVVSQGSYTQSTVLPSTVSDRLKLAGTGFTNLSSSNALSLFLVGDVSVTFTSTASQHFYTDNPGSPSLTFNGAGSNGSNGSAGSSDSQNGSNGSNSDDGEYPTDGSSGGDVNVSGGNGSTGDSGSNAAPLLYVYGPISVLAYLNGGNGGNGGSGGDATANGGSGGNGGNATGPSDANGGNGGNGGSGTATSGNGGDGGVGGSGGILELLAGASYSEGTTVSGGSGGSGGSAGNASVGAGSGGSGGSGYGSGSSGFSGSNGGGYTYNGASGNYGSSGTDGAIVSHS